MLAGPVWFSKRSALAPFTVTRRDDIVSGAVTERQGRPGAAAIPPAGENCSSFAERRQYCSSAMIVSYSSLINLPAPGRLRVTPQKVSARKPRCLRFSFARPPGLAVLPIRCDILYAASRLQQLLQFYDEQRAMARRSATRKCQFGAGA